MTVLLAIDTATDSLSIALHDGETLLAEQTWIAGNRHTVALAPAVAVMLDQASTSFDDLSGLGVAIGPGSYTGLRIGVAFAKGIAATRDLPLVGMTTLDILARGAPHSTSNSSLIAVVKAGRGRIIVQSSRWNRQHWHARSEPRLVTWADLLTTIDGRAIITGEINATGFEALAGSDHDLTIIPAAHRMRRAGYLADYAWEQIRAAGDDRSLWAADQVIPVYLKPDATSGTA